MRDNGDRREEVAGREDGDRDGGGWGVRIDRGMSYSP